MAHKYEDEENQIRTGDDDNGTGTDDQYGGELGSGTDDNSDYDDQGSGSDAPLLRAGIDPYGQEAASSNLKPDSIDTLLKNSHVLFRRGEYNLPSTLTDGQILLNIVDGSMYFDIAPYMKVKPGSGVLGKKSLDSKTNGDEKDKNKEDSDTKQRNCRKIINGNLFGVSRNEEETPLKTVDIPGVPSYFDGLSVTVVFGTTNAQRNSPVSLSIKDTILGTTLQSTPLVLGDGQTQVYTENIVPDVPYRLVWYKNKFFVMSGPIAQDE